MKSVVRNIKNQLYDPIEVKVREATSNEEIGASSSQMAEIADLSRDP